MVLCGPIAAKPEASRPKQGQIRTGDDLFCLKHTGLGSGTKIRVHYNLRLLQQQGSLKLLSKVLVMVDEFGQKIQGRFCTHGG